MLSEKEIATLKDALLTSQRPFFFFHDDPDGLASFLLFYRFIREGRGSVVKAYPQITQGFVKKVEDYGPDKMFILDIAMVDQEFIDAIKVPIFWVDHHTPQERDNIKYFNPRVTKKLNIPTPVLCYQVVQQDLWIATIGAIGDWYFPEYAEEFKKKYPDILPKEVNTVEDALLNTKAGILIKLFSFNLKGSMSEVNTSIKVLTRIESPYEILNQETPAGKLLWKKYEKINAEYEKLWERALKSKTDDLFIVFTYQEDTLSLTKDLANELIARFPDKIIILGREREDEVRCSLRAGVKVRLDLR